MYAVKSWDRPRCAIARLEHGEQGTNPRFIVTDLAASAQLLYERRYCARDVLPTPTLMPRSTGCGMAGRGFTDMAAAHVIIHQREFQETAEGRFFMTRSGFAMLSWGAPVEWSRWGTRVLALLLLALLSVPVQAQRVALLIGNAQYKHENVLANPVRDVRLMGRTLQAMGFRTQVLENLPKREMDLVLPPTEI